METAQDRTIIPAEEVFAIYERNWRFVDERSLTKREADLIQDLAQAFGRGASFIMNRHL